MKLSPLNGKKRLVEQEGSSGTAPRLGLPQKHLSIPQHTGLRAHTWHTELAQEPARLPFVLTALCSLALGYLSF